MSPMLMNDKGFGGRSLRVLASLRLSVVVMVTIGAICAYATFYEMRHGTPAVQRDFYQTSWFAFLLGLLGLNVLAAMVNRWPWSKHHVGFLAAHVGILLVLVGSVVSLYRGLDSNMALYEGETSDRVSLLEPSLQVHVPGLGVSGTFPVRFEKQPPRPGREVHFAVPGGDVVLRPGPTVDHRREHVQPEKPQQEREPGRLIDVALHGRRAVTHLVESGGGADRSDRHHHDHGQAERGQQPKRPSAEALVVHQHRRHMPSQFSRF